MSKSLVDLLVEMLSDAKRFDPDVKDIDRDIVSIISRFEHEGVGFLTNALPSLGLALDQGLARRKFSNPVGFKTNKGWKIPRLFGGFFQEVFDRSTGELKEDFNVSILKSLRQILLLFKKLKLTSSRDEILDRKARIKFQEIDRRLQNVKFDERRVDLLRRVSRLMLPNLIDIESLDFRNGPGAVFEKLGGNSKYKVLVKALRSFEFPLGFGLHSFSYGMVGIQEVPAIEDVPFGKVSRLVTVPKNSSSKRTITVEPVVRQFLQQGLNEALRSEILRCPILSQSLTLHDQKPNQQLAIEGSITGDLSTLDLSAASDSVSQEIVNLVFESQPEFLRMINLVRTPFCNIGDKPIEQEKFAGMGNATTFPVQSVIFAAICIAAAIDLEGLKPSYQNVVSFAKDVRVYGDDIITKTKYVTSTKVWLESFGFSLNMHKSFYEGNFRESCGVDAFKGHVVTPHYLKTELSRDLGPSSLKSLVELSNSLFENCYYGSAEFIKRIVERKTGKLPLCSNDDEFLGWKNRLQARTYHRWDRYLQKPVTRILRVTSKKVPDRIDGYPALLKFFVTPLLGREGNHLEETTKKFNVRLRKAYG